MTNGKAKSVRAARTAAGQARAAARKVQALANGQARPFKARAKQFRRVAKRVGGGAMTAPNRTSTRTFSAPAARGFENRARNIVRSQFICNDTAISVNIKGIATTATNADMVFMFSLNPGLPPDSGFTPGQPSYINGMSNWSSQIAKLYQKHSLANKRCHVTVNYKSTCGSTQAGEVGITFFRNAMGAVPTTGSTSRQQYVDQSDRVYGSVWKDHTIRFTQDPKDKRMERNIRVGAPAIPVSDGAALTTVATDLNTMDYGFCVVWLDGVTSGTSVGNIDISYCWEVNTPNVVLANITSAPEISAADHYQLVNNGDTSTIAIPLVGSSSVFSITDILELWSSTSGTNMHGLGAWNKKVTSTLGTSIVPVGGYLNFPDAGLYTVMLQVFSNNLPSGTISAGDTGLVNIRTPSGVFVMYDPITITTIGGCSIVTSDFEDTVFAPFTGYCMGGGNLTVNEYFHNGWINYSLIDVTDPATASVSFAKLYGNYGSYNLAPTAALTKNADWGGDLIVMSMGDGFTKRYREWKKKKEEEKKMTLGVMKNIVKLCPSLLPLISDVKVADIKAIGDGAKTVTASGIVITSDSKVKVDIDKKDISPTPSMIDKVLTSLKDDYVMLPLKKEKETDQKRSRSNPPIK